MPKTRDIVLLDVKMMKDIQTSLKSDGMPVQWILFQFYSECIQKACLDCKHIKRRKNLNPGSWTFVWANHFVDGRPTPENPNPTLLLTLTEDKVGHTPTKKGCLSNYLEIIYLEPVVKLINNRIKKQVMKMKLSFLL